MPVLTAPSAPSAPAFQTGAPFLFILPLVIAVAILVFVGGRGVSVLKKRGVAWGLTALMIVAAIGIGYGKAAAFNNPTPDVSQSTPPVSETVPPDLQQGPSTFPSYVRDDAGVLSDAAERTLYERNLRLYGNYGVAIAVVTCNYGRSDLGSYVDKCGEEMNLGYYDMIVVLDISGDNYWLGRGENLARDFTDDDCSDYAWTYMEDAFAAGNYDRAVLDLTEMLEAWYGVYFG